MTNHERKSLLEAYSEYVNGRFSELTGFVVLVVGFCLGTLSAQKIQPIYNFVIVVVVLVTFLYLMLNERKAPDSNLKSTLHRLEEKYKNKENNKEIMEELSSYDIWNGFSGRAVKSNFPLMFGVVFCIYTLIEHAAKAFCWW
ncbi:hypothetical protein NDJ00_15320 [Vibrio parahaemolyticus]|uniref:hypothetical protein n=1 Tax=Vibrio parahaemolyticus TaxID=670 RepID=UPI00215F6D39|nr:hypothetical protein [Vibrio parahaemolyticus]EGQ8301922.1 hypothetical protein [Vibrio parahaemolyticus]MCS0115543.1 hypothetical protein [Vibrio parahaemolyticus]